MQVPQTSLAQLTCKVAYITTIVISFPLVLSPMATPTYLPS